MQVSATLVGFLGLVLTLGGLIILLAGAGIVTIRQYVVISPGVKSFLTGTVFILLGVILIIPDIQSTLGSVGSSPVSVNDQTEVDAVFPEPTLSTAAQVDTVQPATRESSPVPSINPTEDVTVSPQPTLSTDGQLDAVQPNVAASQVFSGLWTLNTYYERVIDSGGNLRDASGGQEYLIQFEQVGNDFSGEVIGATGSACTDIRIDGQVVDGQLEMSWEFDGNCCGGAEKVFTGTLENSKIHGDMSPVGRPPGSCNLYWGTFEAEPSE